MDVDIDWSMPKTKGISKLTSNEKFHIHGNKLSITNVTILDEGEYIGEIVGDHGILVQQCSINLTVSGKLIYELLIGGAMTSHLSSKQLNIEHSNLATLLSMCLTYQIQNSLSVTRALGDLVACMILL